MPEMIRIKLDLNKVVQDALFPGKNGASYLDLTLIPSKNSQYGDSHFAVQDLGKEARQAGKKGPIIGNAKIIERKAEAPKAAPTKHNDDPDSVPY